MDPGGLDARNVGLEVCGVWVDVGQAGLGSPAGRGQCWSRVSKERWEVALRQRPRCPKDDMFDRLAGGVGPLGRRKELKAPLTSSGRAM